MLKDRIKGKVTFQYYQDKNLVYKCDDGFLFNVPIEDCGFTRFEYEDKGMLFMKWIQKAMKVSESDKEISNG